MTKDGKHGWEAHKHTPGPWTLGDDSSGKALSIWAEQPVICITSVFDNRLGNDTPPMKQALANARLIAAAPDLLAALEGVLRVADRQTDEFDAARATIAKARGETP